MMYFQKLKAKTSIKKLTAYAFFWKFYGLQ